MDMYVRMVELKRAPDDNPSVGIILCTHKDASIVRYSGLHENEQLFASKYKLVLPSEEELRAELDRERAFKKDWFVANLCALCRAQSAILALADLHFVDGVPEETRGMATILEKMGHLESWQPISSNHIFQTTLVVNDLGFFRTNQNSCLLTATPRETRADNLFVIK